jgi:hypothetical protein
MRLRDLDAEFVGNYRTDDGVRYSRLGERIVDGVQGLQFQCPKCAIGCEPGEENGRRFVRGAHYVLCWFTNSRNTPNVPADAFPLPGRWTFEGTSIDDITFTGPGAASVLITGPGCGWHGFIRSGEATLS